MAIAVLALLCAASLVGSSRRSAAQTGPSSPSSPVPTIETLSPNSKDSGGAAFTLSVIGANFQPGSAVHLNGKVLKTTFVSSTLVTAEIPAGSLYKTAAITVSNSTPAAVTSNALKLAVPCPIVANQPASTPRRARVGAYYFDGWSGPLNKPGFNDLLLTQYRDRQPLSGWQDASTCALDQQLAWAHNFGIDFFVFDWYFNPAKNAPGQNLNSALDITRGLSDRHGVQYAIMYVNHEPFAIAAEDWSSAVNQWLAYMTDADYVRVNGKPLFVIYDVSLMRKIFGSPDAVAKALGQLRAAAVARGLPGVYVAGGFHPGYDLSSQNHSLPDLSMTKTEGYDALTMYGYAVAGRTGQQPFSVLANIAQWIWQQVAQKSPLPFIPTVRDGWDERPIKSDGIWYSRSPQEVATLVKSAITWAGAHPKLRPEPSPAPPIVFIEAWNELSEGSFIVPTVGAGTSYGDALGAMLQP
jgi:glycosyl transferase family WbsX/IPT/TIG domain-containing protein